MSSFNDSTINPDEPAKVSRAYVAQAAQQLASHPDWAEGDPKLTDTQAMNLIAREMSGEEWDADTLDVIAAYVRGTGRNIADPNDAVEVWTLTVDARDGKAIVTTVHGSEDAAIACLFDNYDQCSLYERGDVQALQDGECLVVNIQSHRVVLP